VAAEIFFDVAEADLDRPARRPLKDDAHPSTELLEKVTGTAARCA